MVANRHLLKGRNAVGDDLLRQVRLFNGAGGHAQLPHIIFAPTINRFLGIERTGVIGAAADLVKNGLVANLFREVCGVARVCPVCPNELSPQQNISPSS